MGDFNELRGRLEGSGAGGYQEPACMHETPLGVACERCGGGIVGGDYPGEIKPGQIWRARGYPHGKAGVLKKTPGGWIGIVTRHGVDRWCEEDFREEFFFWGAQPPELEQLEKRLRVPVQSPVLLSIPEFYRRLRDTVRRMLDPRGVRGE